MSAHVVHTHSGEVNAFNLSLPRTSLQRSLSDTAKQAELLSEQQHVSHSVAEELAAARAEDVQRFTATARRFSRPHNELQLSDGSAMVGVEMSTLPSATLHSAHLANGAELDHVEPYPHADMHVTDVHSAENSVVRFHTAQKHTAVEHIDTGAGAADGVLGTSEAVAPVDVSTIVDPDIRAYLDPSNDSVSVDALDSWSDDKLDALVSAISYQHYPRLLRLCQKSGTTEPAKPLTFSHVNFTDATGVKRLQDVSGYLLPGELVGIIAAPDAGASTLLDLLSSKQLQGVNTGELLYGNQSPDRSYQKAVGYIDQSDTHLPLLTVEETLFVASRLRVPSTVTDRKVRLCVRTMMVLLGLTHVKDSLVGDEMVKGISGGQKRRLSVGLEMVAGHSVLLADLPTNGLDSATAFELIRTFRHMVSAGLSMMCTVVQAGSELFQLFHRVIVMSKGSVIYSGPPSMVDNYFKSIGFSRPESKSIPQFLEELSAAPETYYVGTPLCSSIPTECTQDADARKRSRSASSQEVQPLSDIQNASASPPSFFVSDDKWVQCEVDAGEAAGVVAPPTGTELNQKRVDAWMKLNSTYRNTLFYADTLNTVRDLSSSLDSGLKKNSLVGAASASKLLPNHWTEQYNSSPWIQFKTNLQRQVKIFHRNRSSWLHVWIQAIIMGFMLGSIFYDLQGDEVRTRVGLYFYLGAYVTFNSFGILPIVLAQRGVLYAQLNHKYFSAVTYYAALTMVQVGIVVVELLLLLIPIWGLSGLAGFPLSGAFWFAFLMLLTATFAARHWIMFMCYLVPSDVLSTTVLTVTFYIFTLLSGEFIPKPSAPPGWAWAYNLSYMFWNLEGLVLNDYVDAGVIMNLLGLDVYAASKWDRFENVLYFMIGFGAATVAAITWVNWSVAGQPSAPDFVSVASEQHEEAAVTQATQDTQHDSTAVTTPARIAFLEFSNLNYSVTLPSGEKKQLLHSVYGYARAGRLVALMGQSGVGKSTLLDVLAQRKSTGTVDGTIRINGAQDPKVIVAMSGYVEQFDSHNPLSTVREAIRFSGRLRLSKHVSAAELDSKVDRVLDRLELRAVQHNIIGFPGMGGISLELRKKLTIAVEVIAEPPLLFLDEPTTGLDSHSAANVMKTIRALAESITVVCTIHQPPADIVEYFQDVLLLQDGGKVVYFGDIQQLPAFLHEAGAAAMTPGRNVSDYALEVVSENSNFHEQTAKNAVTNSADGVELADLERGGNVKDLPKLFLQSRFAAPMRSFFEHGMLTAKDRARIGVYEPLQRPGFGTQLSELTSRFFVSSIRHRSTLMVRYIFGLILGFVVGTVYLRLGTSQQSGPQHLAAIFFTVGHFLFSASSFFPAIFMNRTLYYREHSSNIYSPLAYFTARFVSDVPHILFEVFTTTLLVYFVVGLSGDDHSARYGYFFWCCLVLRITAIFFTQFVASVIAAPDFAFAVLSTLMYLMFALSGFFIPNGDIPVWWKWLSDLVPLKYALQFLGITEYRDQLWSCDPSDPAQVAVTYAAVAQQGVCGNQHIQTFPNVNDPSGLTVLKCHYACGAELLDEFGVDSSVEWQIQSFAILHCFMIALVFASFLAFRFINHVKR